MISVYAAQEKTLSLDQLDKWVDGMAKIIAAYRFGPGVAMGGQHNPTPGEIKSARDFFTYEVLPVICIEE